MKYLVPIILGLLSIFTPWASYGSDLMTQKNPLYPFVSSVFLQDEFISGTISSGAIGSLGWLSSGTISSIASEANRPGIFRLDTGAVAGTHARLSFHNGSSIDPSSSHQIIWITRLNTNDSNTQARIGEANSVAANPPTHGIYFEKLDADTNWFCVTRAAAVQTRTDTGVAVNTAFDTFSFTRNSSGVTFYLNQTAVCSQSTNIPTNFTSMYLYIINSAAASKTMDVDYGQVIITGLSR